MSLEVSGQAASAGGQVVMAQASARVLVVVASRGDRVEALARAVDSVRGQRAEPADVVLVLPSAAAQARDLAGTRGVRVVDDPGQGLAAAVNAGLAAAEPRHRYVTWLTPDDELLPGALARAVDALEHRPRAVLAFGDCRYLTADGEYLLTPHDGILARARQTGLGDSPAPSAMLIRRSELEAVGGLDETLTEAADLDLFLKLRRRGHLAATGRTLAVFHRARRGPGAEQLRRLRIEVARIRAAELPGALRRGADRWWTSPLACSGPRSEARAQRAADWR
jgi:GT2 family glycosyltransferase